MARDDRSSDRPLPVEPIRLIALDLDGTLLDARGAVSAANAAAIAMAREGGIRVVLATMRPPRGVATTAGHLGLDGLHIHHNGALIFDQAHARVVHHEPLPGATARRVIEIAQTIAPRAKVGVEVIDRLYTAVAGRLGKGIPGHGGSPDGDMDAALEQPVTKILITGSTAHLADIQHAVATKTNGGVTFATSHLRLLQVVAPGVDKARALERVARHYGVGRRSVMAVGDAPNDLGMLRWAGLSVAVANGWEDVRRAAQFVVPAHDRDGVAEAIRRYAL